MRGNLFIGESFSRSVADEKIPTSDLAVFLGMTRCGLGLPCIPQEIATSLALLAMTDGALLGMTRSGVVAFVRCSGDCHVAHAPRKD